MQCPHCQAATAVIEKRDSIRRRRECSACSHRFTTYEVLASELEALREDRHRLERLGRQLGEVMESMRPIEAADTQPAALDLELPR